MGRTKIKRGNYMEGKVVEKQRLCTKHNNRISRYKSILSVCGIHRFFRDTGNKNYFSVNFLTSVLLSEDTNNKVLPFLM